MFRSLCFVVCLLPAPFLSAGDTVSVRTDRELGQALVTAQDETAIKLVGAEFGDISISASAVRISGKNFGRPPSGDVSVKLEGSEEERPVVGSITLSGGAKWTLSGLRIQPSPGSVGVQIAQDHIEVSNCVISFGDSSEWTVAEWTKNAGDGIRVRSGQHVSLLDNYLESVADGINVYKPAEHVIVRGNTIENFCMDGIRALADHGLYENNVVMNAHVINDNHADMLQSWSTGANGKPGTGVITDVVIRGNKFIAHTDPDQPFLRRGRSGVQGIGMFNGVFKDFVIENNLVVADHFHGITVYGADNVRVENNTVVDFDQQFPGPPWISIKNARNGCVIRGNIRMKVGSSDARVEQQGNVEIRFSDYSRWFLDAENGDFRQVLAPPVKGVGATIE